MRDFLSPHEARCNPLAVQEDLGQDVLAAGKGTADTIADGKLLAGLRSDVHCRHVRGLGLGVLGVLFERHVVDVNFCAKARAIVKHSHRFSLDGMNQLWWCCWRSEAGRSWTSEVDKCVRVRRRAVVGGL
jgi:hypothetical protein